MSSNARYGNPFASPISKICTMLGLVQPRHRFRFRPEALELLGIGVLAAEDHLERDQAIQSQVPGPVDDAHAAAADLGQEFVTGHPGEIARRRRFGDRDRSGSGRCRLARRWGQLIRDGSLFESAFYAREFLYGCTDGATLPGVGTLPLVTQRTRE